jgi:hypothetical protein
MDEGKLAEIEARLQHTVADFREIVGAFGQTEAEILSLRAAITKHAAVTSSNRVGPNANDLEMYAALSATPRRESVRQALLVVEAARRLAEGGRGGEDQNRRALLATLHDYDEVLGHSNAGELQRTR